MMVGRNNQTQQGFTLLEMLVVILIIAVAFSFLTYGVTQGLENSRDRQVKIDLAMALRDVRSLAILSGHTTLIRFDLEGNGYQIPGRAEYFLPRGMTMRLTTATSLLTNEGAIAFYPNGSSSGGNIVLEKGTPSWRVDIAWLTGRVSWTDLGQP